MKENGERLKNLPLFKNMAEEDINAALKCVGAFFKEYRKDEFIALENDKLKCVGCVLEGSVQMIREDIWGNKAMIMLIGANELFGESFACGSDATAYVSFVANEKSRVLFLPFDRVLHSCSSACGHHQSLLTNMITLIAEKNVALMSKIDVISKKSLREKIAAYLLVQAGNQNSKYITIPLGRVQLAEYLNVDRSALTRELNQMKEEGYIDFDKNTFRILKKI